MPGTVISLWSGQLRQKSHAGPVRIAPGSALTNSFGMPSACASHAAYPWTIS